MPTTIIDQIIELAAAAIEAVTVANGYQVNVVEVYRPKSLRGHNRNAPVSYTVQLLMGDPAENEELALMGNPPIIAWDQPLKLDCIFRPSDTASEAIEKELNVFWSDVSRALMFDPQWTDLAIDSVLTSPEYDIDAAGTCYVTGHLNITYRVKDNDPWTRWQQAPSYTAILNGGEAGTEDYDAIIIG